MLVNPSTHATTSETASEAPARGPLGQRVKSSARWISSAVNTEDADGGCSGPPGIGSHGTSSTASDHEGEGPGDRHHRGDPPALVHDVSLAAGLG